MGEGSDAALGRRGFIGKFGMGFVGIGALAGCAGTAPPQVASGGAPCAAPTRLLDLSHPITGDFSIGSPPRFWLEAVDGSGKDAGMLLNRLSIVEHTGTHLDAPSHFDAAATDVSQIPLDDLVVPLAVLDMREEAAATTNFSLTPAHIESWEAVHGRLPDGGCLALWTGFDVVDAMRRFGARQPLDDLGMTGIAPETSDWLTGHRNLKGVAVDSLTLDSRDHTPAYPFHKSWLRDGRWGIEAIANLGSVPATGATLVVGLPPIAGATGMPVRAFAMI